MLLTASTAALSAWRALRPSRGGCGWTTGASSRWGRSPFPCACRAHHRTGAGGDSGDDVGIDLLVEPMKPLVLQGDRGLSRKGSRPGNASYYYSFTRLRTAGSVRLGEGTYQVDGHSWLDHEWSSSALEANQVGWDWFALQLQDDTELTFYQIRQSDGTPSPQSAGVLVDPSGTTVNLTMREVELTVDRTWRSPIDGVEYPAAWTILVPAPRSIAARRAIPAAAGARSHVSLLGRRRPGTRYDRPRSRPAERDGQQRTTRAEGEWLCGADRVCCPLITCP